MTWSTLRNGPHHKAHPNPELRIYNQRSGNLNRAAMDVLFGQPQDGRIEFQEDEVGHFSIITVAQGGYTVTKRGRTTVTRLTAAVDDALPVTLLLGTCSEEHRLLIVGAR